MELFRMGEVMKATGLTRKALRHYDDLGIVKAVKKPYGERNLAWYYDQSDIRKLKVIKLYRTFDIPLSHIREVIEGGEPCLDQITEDIIEYLDRKKDILNSQYRLLESLRAKGFKAVLK